MYHFVAGLEPLQESQIVIKIQFYINRHSACRKHGKSWFPWGYGPFAPENRPVNNSPCRFKVTSRDKRQQTEVIRVLRDIKMSLGHRPHDYTNRYELPYYHPTGLYKMFALSLSDNYVTEGLVSPLKDAGKTRWVGNVTWFQMKSNFMHGNNVACSKGKESKFSPSNFTMNHSRVSQKSTWPLPDEWITQVMS